MCLRSIVPVVLVLLFASRAHADKPISIEVDARGAARRVLSAKLVIPAPAGTLALRFPKWIPGEHGPTGPYQNTSKLAFSAGGKSLAWVRDSVDLSLIRVTVPSGASEVTAEVESVLPAEGLFSAGATATEQIAVVSWQAVLLYPDGKLSDDVRFRPALRLATGWKLGTALATAKQTGDRTDFDEVTLTTLVDSPVLAGSYVKEIELAAKPKVRMVIAADSPEALAIHRAGLAPGMKIVAVAGRAFTPERLRDAIARTKTKPGIEMITQHGDAFRVATLDVRTGLRYPVLVRKAGTTDVFGAILTAKVK